MPDVIHDKDEQKRVLKKKGLKIKEHDSFLQHIGYSNFFMSLFFLIMHPAPFLLSVRIKSLTETYYLGDPDFISFSRQFYEYPLILMLFYSFINCFLIFLETRQFLTHRTRRIAKMGDHSIGYIFALRSFLKKYELGAPIFLLLFGASFFSVIFRVTETSAWTYVIDNVAKYPDEASHEAAKGEFQVLISYVNSLWFVFITITTVGYGDIYVKATFSRIIMYLFGLWSMISLSMTIATFFNLLSLDADETRYLNLMNFFRLTKQVSCFFNRGFGLLCLLFLLFVCLLICLFGDY